VKPWFLKDEIANVDAFKGVKVRFHASLSTELIKRTGAVPLPCCFWKFTTQ